MLEELTEFSSFGAAEHIRLILGCLSKNSASITDLTTLAYTKGSVDVPRVQEVIALLVELGICHALPGGTIALTIKGTGLVVDSDDPVHKIGLLLFLRLCETGILPISSIRFDVLRGRYFVTSTAIKSRYAAFRNLLIVSGVLEVSENLFLLCSEAEDAVKHVEPEWEGGMTPEQLAAQLNKDKEAGELAEQYVMDYEHRRLGTSTVREIERVSLMSVSAGFDIASFETSASSYFDRLIEVKAYGRNGFYLSSGELEAARQYGQRYFIYIIELSKIAQEDYIPLMIRDPVNFFKSCDDWRITPDRLKITRLPALDD